MPFETGSYANAKALFDRIVTQVQATGFMGSGNEWTLKYSFDGWGASSGLANGNQIIKAFELPGPSGTGDWHLGMRLILTGANTANFVFAMYKTFAGEVPGGPTHTFLGAWSSASVSYSVGEVVSYSSSFYVCIQAHTSTATNPSSLGTLWAVAPSTTSMWAIAPHVTQLYGDYQKSWNGGSGDIPYWLVADASRLALVIRSDSRYFFGYAGALERFGAPGEYPLPGLICANNQAEADTYLDSGNVNFPHSNGSSSHPVDLKTPLGNSAFGSEVRAFPPGGYTTTAAIGRRPNGDWPLMPVLIFFLDSSTNERGFAGTMIGVFGTDSRGSASGDLIEVGGQDYLLVENVNRGEGDHFIALKLA